MSSIRDQTSLRILLIDDSKDDAELIERQFHVAGIQCRITRVDSMSVLQTELERAEWDVALSDYSLPMLSGLEVIHEIRALKPHLPVILVSGSVGEERAVESIRLGARDYVLKDKLTRLVPAVVREVEESRVKMRRRALESELAESQKRLDRLCRYFPRAVAEKVTLGEQGDPFAWHRSHVAVVFVDLRGFSNLVELAKPEDVVRLLNAYYSKVAEVVSEFGGSIGHVAGDGIMIFFNDPIELANPEQIAVNSALRLSELLGSLRREWAKTDYAIDFGAGVASGCATVGLFGVEGCWDYSIIGSVANMAARLCAVALPGQVLVPQQILTKISSTTALEFVGEHLFKGFLQSVKVFNVMSSTDAEDRK